jgi:hypothetical protein
MGLYPVVVCYNARQDNTIQYDTIQYKNTSHRITHITQNNITHSGQLSVRKITKNQEHILCTIKTQKQGEPTLDESVLKTSGYTKQ